MRAVCLQRVPFEGPVAIATSLANLGVTLDYHLAARDGLPTRASDLLIVMGD